MANEQLEDRDILDELKTFYGELQSYQKLLNLKGRLVSKKVIRQNLVRMVGALKAIVIELTGRQYVSRAGHRYEIWHTALGTVSLSSRRDDTLAFCIDAVNEAIGKLKSDIQMGVRDRQGKKIEKSQLVSTEPLKAFIAHGGDSPALAKLKSFLDALGVQPLIVEEQPSEGRSIAINVDYYARQSDFAIILATKGDVDGKTGGFIPRGNVLMEIGKLQELLKDRIVYLVQAGTKLPTNISEKVRVRFSPQSMDNSFIKIAKELRNWGFLITGKIEE